VSNKNGTHDLGPLQINSFWVPKLARITRRSQTLVRHWLIHDACFNANSARWIFLSGLSISEDYWSAIGVYHSPSPLRQRRYSRSVATKLTQRFGPEVFGRPLLGRDGVGASRRSAP
jgi:hypothetical protein